MAIFPATLTTTGNAQTQGIAPVRSAQLSLKASIVETSMDVSFSVRDQPLGLIYRSAVEKLNEQLESKLGPEPIQAAAAADMDFSPGVVAERIVSFATGFFDTYAGNHGGEKTEEQLSGFMNLIRDAIDQGFKEASDILDGLGVLQGGIKDNADRTYDLIQEKLDAFEQHTAESLDLLKGQG